MNIVLVGLGYGKDGKRAFANWVASHKWAYGTDEKREEFKLSAAVRYNGTAEGYQIGGSSEQGLTTIIMATTVVDPIRLLNEAKSHGNKARPVAIDPCCPIVTPYHELVPGWLDDYASQQTVTTTLIVRSAAAVGAAVTWSDLAKQPVDIVPKLCKVREWAEQIAVRRSELASRRLAAISEINPYVVANDLRTAAAAINASPVDWSPGAGYLFEGSRGLLASAEFNRVGSMENFSGREAQHILDFMGWDYVTIGVMRWYIFTDELHGSMGPSVCPDLELYHNPGVKPGTRYARTTNWYLDRIRTLVRKAKIDALVVTCLDLLPSRALPAVELIASNAGVPVIAVSRGEGNFSWLGNPTTRDRKLVYPVGDA